MKSKKLVKSIKSSESTISVILGILVVVVVGILLFKYFRNYALTSRENRQREENIEITGEVGEEEKPLMPVPAKYMVVAGDSLWKISEKYYGSGYNWVDIQKENNIIQPNKILISQELTIPDVPVKSALVSNPQITQAEATEKPITQDKYTVVKGDNLWKICVRAYQDGYKWPEIAKANRLANPDLIHPGNVLVIPQ